MTLHMKNPTAGGAAGLENASLPGGIDGPSNAPKTAPAQDKFRNPRAVKEARLELPREAVHEACGFILSARSVAINTRRSFT